MEKIRSKALLSFHEKLQVISSSLVKPLDIFAGSASIVKPADISAWEKPVSAFPAAGVTPGAPVAVEPPGAVEPVGAGGVVVLEVA